MRQKLNKEWALTRPQPQLDLSHSCQIRLNLLLIRAALHTALQSSVIGLRVGAQVASLRCPIFRSAHYHNIDLYYYLYTGIIIVAIFEK
jgi:hypothetical protein